MTLAKKIIPLLLIKCIIAFSPKADYKSSYSRIRNNAITTVAPTLTELPCWHNSRIKRHCSHHSMVGNHVASVVNIVSRGGNNNSFLRNLHTDQTFVLSAILLLSSFGVTLEKKTQFGKALSAPLATMTLALIVANLGLVPFASPLYGVVTKNLVPLAVPLLLYDSDLRRVLNGTGSLLFAFIVGAFSTIVGTVITYPLIPLKSLGIDQGWRVASALAARHIGGAINFVAVADTLNVGSTAVSAAIAADNVVVALYFAFLFYLSKPGEDDEITSMIKNTRNDLNPIDSEKISEVGGDAITMASLGLSLTVASCLVTIGNIFTKLMLPVGISSLPLISIATVAGATMFPQFFNSIRASGAAMGVLFMQMFFAASGFTGNIKLVLESAPTLFLFSASQIAIHFLTLIGVGRFLFGLKKKELYLASNANVGGPTTAAAMAQAKEWNSLVLPSLLVGILGYSCATPIALGLGQILIRLPKMIT